MPTIAITTDFGIKDGNVAVMKGVIWGICPEARIADVSHMIGPQNIREAALVLARSAGYFPQGTVQLVVVDPGVGTTRRALAARIGESFYVGPDNGIVTPWLQTARAEGLPIVLVELDQNEYWRPTVSPVFHGRDIFAPVAAHLARGVPLSAVGSPIDDPVELEVPRPRRVEDGWEGEIIHVDHFGNLSSDILAQDLRETLDNKERISVRVGKARVRGIIETFGQRPPGATVALFGSTGNLIIAVVNGDAASRLGVRVGDRVVVTLDSQQ